MIISENKGVDISSGKIKDTNNWHLYFKSLYYTVIIDLLQSFSMLTIFIMTIRFILIKFSIGE